MKKAVIVTPFDNYSYEVRIKYVERYLTECGYTCEVLSSNFDHRNKVKYNVQRDNITLLHVPEYKRNLSFSRIYSHYILAKSVYLKLLDIKPDLIYGSAPPNLLFRYLSKYKRKNEDVELIYEVGDLWPETLPIPKKIKNVMSPILNIWAGLRNYNIKYADAVVYECDLFHDRLKKYHPNTFSKTIYLCKKNYVFPDSYLLMGDNEILKFSYIGSINNIIDIDTITEILVKISRQKKVIFKIIGIGENKEKLVSSCENAGIEVLDFGIVYDNKKKYEILKDCHFAFNIMKKSVAVGVTMKSLEYLHWGLILINNIPADTAQIVERYRCGINITTIDQAVDWIITEGVNNIVEFRQNARLVYEKLFDETVIKEAFYETLRAVDNIGR